MDKDRTISVCRIAAAVLFVAAGIIYVSTVTGREQYREFPVSAKVTADSEERAVSESDVSDESTAGITYEPEVTPLLVNINSAEAKELMLLPGIGVKKAAAIIEYRSLQGEFSVKEDIMLVPGIKDGIFEKIKDFIYVEEESDA